jgi:hypothetical protein
MDFASLNLIADFYNTTTDYLFGRGDIEVETYSTDETKIITKYRQLDKRGKEAIKANLSFEMSQTHK